MKTPPRRRSEPRGSKGFGLSLLDRIQNEGSVHQEVVQAVERITKRNLVVYTAFLRHPASAIVQEDSHLVEHLLRSVDLGQYPDTLDLLLHTPGGDPTAAERIVMTCRAYAKSLRVIVARSAMSAGTLIAMGADRILMAETAELGPIDPQMILTSGPEQALRPAAAFVDAYLDLIQKSQEAIAGGRPPHPYIELRRKVDPTSDARTTCSRRDSRSISWADRAVSTSACRGCRVRSTRALGRRRQARGRREIRPVPPSG